MRITDYHAKYFAWELTRRFPPDSPERLAGALVDAQVDLNPHQVDAALFAFQSPLSQGSLLADEVGLGKTIEAGLVLSQRWAERRRRILVITPSNLRKQWYQELTEKFFLPCRILESKSYNAALKAGSRQPFQAEEIVICSYQFAKSKETDVTATSWDLVVVDEAHRLRNVYKPSNVTANSLKRALTGRQKLLLTATPLQNSLLELYGLVSFIDEHAFGDVKSFREQFATVTQPEVYRALKARLAPICHRTLRRQVTAYVPYTKRLPVLERFTPEESEDRLYDLVSEYLQRDNLQALPASQRSLMTLVLRKLLASSTFAIAGALTSIAERLKAKLARQPKPASLEEELDEDYEALDETAEEWPDEDPTDPPLSVEDRDAIAREIADLEDFARLARGIKQNAKGTALLRALDIAFAKARALGGADKAIIFTESRRTQNYLLRILADTPLGEDVVLFNGSNTDDRSKAIYQEWLHRHQGTDRVTGSRTADMRSALVDWFRERGRIMIATEAGAEGINLQFCSLVVNYDLPWNPQRIEQRIGRCHRYGQKHDVVVVNFLNTKNAADQRVFELLSEKFQLFEGVFGASDEVLGAIESGVDFERRIADIYQRARKPEEIKEAFDKLQLELNLEINQTVADTRRKLLENFDDEVREKLRDRDQSARDSQGRFERMLMDVTRHELGGDAEFRSDSSFWLKRSPYPGEIPVGLYELPRRSGEAHFYRLNHPLGEAVIAKAKARELPVASISFDLSGHEGRVSILQPFTGRSGWLSVECLRVQSLDRVEEHLIHAAICDDGSPMDDEQAGRLFNLAGEQVGERSILEESLQSLRRQVAQRSAVIRNDIGARNLQFFQDEVTKLEGWADDLKLGLERDLKELDRQIKEARRVSATALTLEEKLTHQKQIKSLEGQRREKRRSLFEAQDAVDRQRDELIAAVEARLQQAVTSQALFTIQWRVR
jgi:adenine-specific DNA-methyltransferase